jgi:hypothetical protein
LIATWEIDAVPPPDRWAGAADALGALSAITPPATLKNRTSRVFIAARLLL